ncbi:MAG TPA: carboxypeptidase-like regulatory domain-containing protein [Candidatus Thermoplasmatota archaeon]|nr:carboxypeptidase-like regulatory domain-containing protein [Candidatus Thermoplasmatota archaeon]
MRILLATIVLALLLVSGCASTSDPPSEELPADFEQLELEATATTGIIRGIVVDSAIRPISGASVTLKAEPPQTVTSTEDGAFGFDALEPGTYFLSVHKIGFADVQQSAEVDAGVESPPVVKVQLVSDGKPAPFFAEYKVEGIIECGTSVIALCGGAHDVVVIACVASGGAVCAPQPTNDAYSAFLAIDGTPDYVQTEMTWETTQALGDSMSYALRYADKATYDGGMYEGGFDSFEGPSPLLGHISGDDAADAELGNRTGMVFSIFSGGAQGTPLGVTVEQQYTFFIHAFYGYQPPEDWRFTSEGTVPPPQ